MRKALQLLVLLISIISCATFKSAKVEPDVQNNLNLSKGSNVFLIGDAGKLKDGSIPTPLASLEAKFSMADKNDVLLFLGDNVYTSGIPEEGDKDREEAERTMKMQIDVAKKFPGKAIFVPGNHDWYSGLDGLKRQEQMVEAVLGKDSFLPEDGCPLSEYVVNDDLAIIAIDSEWYITDWDNHPDINEQCEEINSREKFLEEFRGMVNDHQTKTIILAVHHPLFTNGQHDGQYPFNLAFPINIIRKTSGAVPADIHYPLYDEFVRRVSTIISDYQDNVIVVSGHEHNLQYIERDGIRQIVSGAGAKQTPLKTRKDEWGYADKGYAILNVKPSLQTVEFYNETGEAIHQVEVGNTSFNNLKGYTANFPKTKKASIYPQDLFESLPNGGGFNGQRYREFYGKEYEFPVAVLDTLYGGLTPVKLGGGFQSVTLRLEDKDGREYNLRRLRKSASQFIQRELFKENYIERDLGGTVSEKVIFDFYTTAFPFAFLTVGDLADAVGVYHTNPKIYYVPKQDRLGRFNSEIGDDLYMIEERPANEWNDLASFGKPDDIESTDDVLEKILNNSNNKIDQTQLIRTRLFDMWLSDWDRHSDQFRWAQFEGEDGADLFSPIPRDRDQAFPKYDGLLLGAATSFIPDLRKMQTIDDDLKSIKYLNIGNYKFDLALIEATELDQWVKQAEYLANQLTDEVIEQAFLTIPKGAQGEVSEEIISHLKARRKHIAEWAKEYYRILNKKAVLTATDKDDIIDVIRNSDGSVDVKMFRNKGGERSDIFVDKQYHPDQTKEIWIYGLNDKDEFNVTGNKASIKVHLIGGDNNDTYNIESKNKVAVYDNKLKKNTYNGKVPKKHITDEYEKNNFNVFKFNHNTNQTLPLISYDPDSGVQLGLLQTFNKQSFSREDFIQTHQIYGKYHTSTNGFDLGYTGLFRDFIKKWGLEIDAQYTTPAYSENFYGYGSSTEYDDDIDFDFYRVRQELVRFHPSLIKEGIFDSFRIGIPVEAIDIDDNSGRLVNQYFAGFPDQLDDKVFTGIEAEYHFRNLDIPTSPSLGLDFNIKAGYKYETKDGDDSFGYIKPQATFIHPIISRDKVILSTKLNSEFNFSDEIIPFYYGAAIGGNNGLRGFRNERFTGESSFYQNTDLRVHLANVTTFLLPGKLGMFGGFDYGKVWLDNKNAGFLNSGEIQDDWNTSYGGGIYLDGSSLFTIKASYFSSDDGGRVVAGLGFDF